MFPRSEVGSVTSIGALAGAIGGALFMQLAGHVLQFWHSYSLLFIIASSVYLISLLILVLFAPGLKRADLSQVKTKFDSQSIISSSLFAGSIACFFLPFVSLSLAGIKIGTITGRELVTGIQLHLPIGLNTDFTSLAAITVLCAVLGAGFSIGGRKYAGASFACGAVGSVSLIFIALKFKDIFQQSSFGLAEGNLEYGLVLAICLLLIATLISVFSIYQNRELPTRAPDNTH
jgi:hypothetical protein